MPEISWRTRELARALTGEYLPVPWALEPWAAPLLAEHFPHVSTDDPTMLAYTPDEPKGEQNRQTRCRPGRYLSLVITATYSPRKRSKRGPNHSRNVQKGTP